jgi:hypothetical protein
MIPTAPKKKFNPILLQVLLISGGIHLIALFILGGITVVRFVIPDDAQFEEPAQTEVEEPPKEVKIEIRPKAAAQPQALRKLRMKQVGNISVATVDIELPSMEESFSVSAGLGGSGGGGLLGGAGGSIGLGMSDVNVFGLKTRAERILFIIDTNRRMVTDEKGGLNSYRVIKDEISDMVGNLSAGTLFNIMLQDHRRIKLFKPQLVPAGSEVHQELIKWIEAVNADASKPGLEGVAGSVWPKLSTFQDNEMQKSVSWGHGDNDTAFMTQVALEQSADAIFMITGYHRGFGNVVAPPSEKQLASWKKYESGKEYQDKLAAFHQEEPEMRQRVANELAKINAKRAKDGLPPRVLRNHANDVRGNARELELDWKHSHPGGGPGHTDIEPRHVEEYFKQVMETRYLNREQQPPSLNVVLFLAGDEVYEKRWQDELKSYVRFFRGMSRIIRGEDEIKSARSAKETKN